MYIFLLFEKGFFEGTGIGNNAIFTYFLYTCNGICSIKICPYPGGGEGEWEGL